MNGRTISCIITMVIIGVSLSSLSTQGGTPNLSYAPAAYDYGYLPENITATTTFTIWNSGCYCATLEYTLNETCDWLEVTPLAGSSQYLPDTITVHINTTGLYPGLYHETISITSNAGSGCFNITARVMEDALVTIGNYSLFPNATDIFSIDLINISDAANITLTVSYDTDVLEIRDVTPGDLGNITATIDNTSGIITLDWSHPQDLGFTGDYELCCIYAHGIGTPQDVSPLVLNILTIHTPQNYAIPYNAINGMVTIQQPPVIYQNITPSDAYFLMLNNSDIIFLDVRTLQEFTTGYIPGAYLFPLNELEYRLHELDKNKTYIVYCLGGGRSMTASLFLVNNGFENVFNLVGGITAWITEGLPIHLPNTTPVASFIYTPQTPYVNQSISFDSSPSYDPDGQISEYAWDFGDGTTSGMSNPLHRYDAPGTYTVTLLVMDNEGATNTSSQTITVLNLPPVAAFRYTPPNPSPDEIVIFNGSDSSDPDGEIIEYFWTYTAAPDAKQEFMGIGKIINYSWPDEGTYTVILRVTDNEGALNFTSLPLRVENKPPTVEILTPLENSLQKGLITIAGLASDPEGKIEKTEIQIDNGPWLMVQGTQNWEYTWDTTGVIDGNHTIIARTSDGIHYSPLFARTIRIDNTPPETTYSFFGIRGPNNWYRSYVIVTLSATDTFSGVNSLYYQIDTHPIQEYNQTFTIKQEGNHTLTYYARDVAGNTEIQQSVTLKIDRTRPETTLSMDPALPNGEDGWYTTEVTVRFMAQDNISGIQMTWYTLDNITWTEYQGAFVIREPGSHIIQWYSRDMAGNTEKIQSHMMKIDPTKPTVTLISPRDNGLYVFDRKLVPLPFQIRIIGVITIQAVANDLVSGIQKVQFIIDNIIRFEDLSSPYEMVFDDISLLLPRHTLLIRAYDNAGNIKTTEKITIWYLNF